MVTWEALEHEGPGLYDAEYLAYLRSILKMLPEYGLSAFVSMHQDVWSRYSGGSGAPAWTLELVGFDLTALEETGAAYLGGVKVPGVEMDRGRWPTGYQKLAASTMSTVFWAGETFAPKLMVERDGAKVNAQTFLQDAFLNCYDWLLRGLTGLEAIVGFELMNEPHRGYISLPSMHEFDYNTDLHLNDVPSALQSFTLGAGHPTKVPHWTRSFPMPTRLTSHNVRNTQGRKVWRADGPTKGQCLWELHGVWGYDEHKKEGVVLKESYFMKDPSSGKKIDWYVDYWYPFLRRWSERVRPIAGHDKIVFVEGIPNEFCPQSWTRAHQIDNMVYAPHWYDLNALFAKAFSRLSVNVQGLSRGMPVWKALYWGHRSARKNYQLQIHNIVEEAYKSLGECPVFIGETGIPMDMNEKQAFNSGDFTWQERMMDALLCGLERSLVGFTLWNYNPDNTDSHGDHWNGENFSWFSKQHLSGMTYSSLDQDNTQLDKGGRILHAVVRPYAAKVAGIPIRCHYEMSTGCYEFDWANPTGESIDYSTSSASPNPSVEKPPLDLHASTPARETEIFVPLYISKGRRVLVEYSSSTNPQAECDWRYDPKRQTLFVLQEDSTPGAVHRIRVTFDPPLEERFPLDESFWWDFARVWVPICAVALAIVYLIFA
ncbi:hypothetical protein FRB99_005289 [Tulasnella sp. 403]|nr:hypothetical protein FRB99_005289 [Tulasnella sp. 403]